MTLKNKNEIGEKLINEIAKAYSPLNYNSELIKLLQTIYPVENFEEYCKYDLHQILNDTLIRNYTGERLLKYELFSLNSKKNVIGAFEMKVDNSRVDFVTINGSSRSFEIKSSLDNLLKLNKQASSYAQVFDYNYLVIDEKHLNKAMEMVPENFGVWIFCSGKKKTYRKALLNEKVNPEVQLNLLTKKELSKYFMEFGGIPKVIHSTLDPTEINRRFKTALKNRYKDRWEFIVEHSSRILPMDLQFFFKTRMPPQHIYFH